MGLFKKLFKPIADMFGATGAESQARDFATAPYDSGVIQGYLPPQLRTGTTDPILKSGMSGVADLIQNPGQLSPTASSAIRPRLAAESERIGTDYRGIGANQAGRLARGNAPVSIKGSLASALDVAQSRAQRGARREALTDSDQLRRADIGQTFNLLNALLQFTSSGRNAGTQGLAGAAAASGQRRAANTGLLGDVLGIFE